MHFHDDSFFPETQEKLVITAAPYGPEWELDDFRELNREHLRRNKVLIRTSGLFHPALGFLSGLAALLGLYLGGREVIAGHITLGEFVAFTVYLAMLNWPMVALGW